MRVLIALVLLLAVAAPARAEDQAKDAKDSVIEFATHPPFLCDGPRICTDPPLTVIYDLMCDHHPMPPPCYQLDELCDYNVVRPFCRP